MLHYQLRLNSLVQLVSQLCFPLHKGKRTKLLADPCKAWGCSTNTFVTDYFIKSPFSQNIFMVPSCSSGASSHEKNHTTIFSEILSCEGHLNSCVGSQVTAILLNGWILPTGGIA